MKQYGEIISGLYNGWEKTVQGRDIGRLLSDYAGEGDAFFGGETVTIIIVREGNDGDTEGHNELKTRT